MNADSKSESSLRHAPLRQRLNRETRRAILQAAEDQIAEQGLGTRMEDIATRAGVSVGSIYNHVGDRSALLGELLAARRAELLDRIDAAIARVKHLPVEAQLTAFVEAVFTHFESHLALFRVVIHEETSQRDARPKHAALALLTERAAELVARGVAEGVLRPDVTALAPALLTGMMRGVFMHALDAEVDLRRAAAEVVSVFMKGTKLS